MRRWMTALSMAAALCISASAVYAGPACCASKKSKDDTLKAKMVAAGNKSCASETKTCSADNAFPAIERKFVVAGQIFDSEEQAWQGLADASERYVKQYTSIACVIDGKVVYCDDKGNATCQSGDAATVALVSAKSDGCCKSGAAKVASTCSKTKAACDKAELAKTSTCDKAAKTALVSATEQKDEPACCKAKMACCEEAKKTGKKGNCCAGEAKVASTEASQCTKAKTAALVSTDGDKPTCDMAAKTSLVKADEKAGCCKSKAAALVKADDKAGCSQSKTAALVKADEKAGCCKSKAAALVKADDKSGCCAGKVASYRVAGRNYESWEKAVAARESAMAAMSNVKMAYLVNGTKVDCASKVCPMEKKAGKVKFVVGETTTGCELHARVELAKAQIDAVSKATEGDQVATR